MLIILEGCDGTGKTTLVRAIHRVLLQRGRQSTLLKASQPRPGAHPLREYAGPLLDLPGRCLTCDRWHVGEDVYGPLYRDGSRLTPAQRTFIDALAASRGAVLVHVTARPDVVRRRCRDRGEDYLRDTDVEAVLTAFKEQTGDGRHWVTVDTSDTVISDADVVASELVDEAELLYEAVRPVIELGTDYVGPAGPRVLLVGDRPASGAGAPPAYGAFTPWHGNSAEYLFDALHDAGVLQPGHVPDVGLVNSHGVPLARLHKELGEPAVIALGAYARAELVAHGVPIIGDVCHPQYQRRFHHRRRAEYGTRLAEIISRYVD